MTLEEQRQVNHLRNLLGESVSESGDATEESIFSDEMLLGYVKSSDNINRAALMGWNVKLAHFANLVNVTDGAAARELSDLFDHAYQMVRHYTNLSKSASWGRSRVGKISRA